MMNMSNTIPIFPMMPLGEILAITHFETLVVGGSTRRGVI